MAFKYKNTATNVYYKDAEGEMHKISADTLDVKEAREAVMDMLEVSKQAFLHQAVLAVVVDN